MNDNIFETIGFQMRPLDNEITRHDVKRYAKALNEAGISRAVVDHALSLDPPSRAYDRLAMIESTTPPETNR